MLKSKYLFSNFSQGLNEQTDELQLNRRAYDSRGKPIGLNFELRRAENIEFVSEGKVNSKPFDQELLSGGFPNATSIETEGTTLFRVDRNSLYQLSKEGNFDLKGKTVPLTIEKNFVSSSVRASSYAYCNGRHYSVTETDQRLKLTVMNETFEKIRTVNIRGFPRSNPYLFCYGTTVFIACFNDQSMYIYTETGHLLFSRSYQHKIRALKGFDRFLFVSLETLGLGYINFLTRGAFQALENATIPDYFDFYYDEDTDLISFFVILNNQRIMKSFTMNRTSFEVEENDDASAGITSQTVESSENKDIIAYGPDSFMMKFPDGTLIKRGQQFNKVLNFDPYYVLPDGRYVVHANNGFFIIDFDGNPIGRFNGNLVPVNVDIFQTGFKYVGNNVVPSFEAHNISALEGVITTNERLTLAQIRENTESGVDMVRAKNTVLISGSLLSVYDGETVTNTNFNQKPTLRNFTAESQNEAHPVFRIACIYRWDDGEGNVYRSEPSNTLLLRFENENIDSKLVRLRVTNLNMTSKRNVSIEVYRSEPNETTLYKALTLENLPNIKEQDFQVDIIPSVLGNEPLYTTGGETANVQPEGARFLDIYNGRVYAARTTDDKRKVIVSRPVSEFAVGGIEFDGLRSLFVPEDITSHEVMDDKYIIFTENQIYFYREGFTEPEVITGATNIGCSDLGATVLDKDGIYFKSKRGVYLLNRGLTLEFIGYKASVSLSERIVKCISSNSKNEIYFLTESGDIVVFNTFFKTFTIRRSKVVRSMATDSEKVYVLDDQSKIYSQDSPNGTYTETFDVETGWIQLHSIINRTRIRELFLLGAIEGIESMRLVVSYDFKEGDIFIQDLSREQINNSKVFGGDEVFQSNEIFGLTDNESMYRFFPNRQNCTSIKLKIRIQSREGFSLSGIGFKYAVKEGFTKTKIIEGV